LSGSKDKKERETMATKKTAWSKDVLRDLTDGNLDLPVLLEMQRGDKEDDRFEAVLAVEQEKVGWPEKILVPIGEHLYVVQKGADRVVKCSCGYEFGDYRQNWKLNAVVYVRDTDESLDEIYPGPRKCDVTWMGLREYYCPDCGTLLEIEAVPPGYPLVFDFLPELD
jgi:acetone carboxylase gamma subunit